MNREGVTLTTEQLRNAAAEETIARVQAHLRAFDALQLDALLEAVDALAASGDAQDFALNAETANINPRALDALTARGIPYPYYFCLPETLTAQPALVAYYRRLALLTPDDLRAIGLDTQPYESGQSAPDPATAHALARLFNGLVSAAVLQSGVTPRMHLLRVIRNVDNIASR